MSMQGGATRGAQIGFGEVRHRRLRPAGNAFRYPTCFLMLPMRALRRDGPGALARNRTALLSFHDRDHGDGGDDALAWLDSLLARHGITDADGEAWLHTYPRVLGHTFKPVSFWYCHRRDGGLRAVVVEVNNTFGERHCYLLPEVAWGREMRCDKAFHVSPFARVEGAYRFRFLLTADGARTVARIEFDDAQGPLIQTSVSGRLEPFTPAARNAALWRHPFLTLGVVARIHWQAARLWLKRVPFHTKPAPPALSVTLQAP